MKRRSLNDLVAALAPVVRPVMMRYFASNCCVATCTLLRRVFEKYGYTVEAIPVTVHVFNARMLAALERNEVPAVGDPGRERWMEVTGAYGVGIVPESATLSAAKGYKTFGGHLVLRVRDLLVDASIAQASRPQHKLDLPNLVATTATDDFMKGKPLGVNVYGCGLRYQRLDDYSFRTAPDWRERERFAAPLREVFAAIEEVHAHATQSR